MTINLFSFLSTVNLLIASGTYILLEKIHCKTLAQVFRIFLEIASLVITLAVRWNLSLGKQNHESANMIHVGYTCASSSKGKLYHSGYTHATQEKKII